MAIINHNLSADRVARTLGEHYGNLATSVQRLSTGLRINSAADDAAGLAIRELMRSDVASLRQGMRNVNDAISMIQVADGALSVIDEKLIRMKELAEQAATGTYDSTQRLMIDSEFQAMGAEIDRIARATDFNNIHLLDGSLSGAHDGSGLVSTGKMKIHFGTANDSAEDYYYVGIGNCTLGGLGLREKTVIVPGMGNTLPISARPGATDGLYTGTSLKSGIIPLGYIPAGSKNVVLTIDGLTGSEDDIQLFTRDGTHISGTPILGETDETWATYHILDQEAAREFLTEENGFLPNASYKLPSNAPGSLVTGVFNDGDLASKDKDTFDIGLLHEETYTVKTATGNKTFSVSYSGDFDWLDDDSNNGNITTETKERVVLADVPVDIVVIVTGMGIFNAEASWDEMPLTGTVEDATTKVIAEDGDVISIKTQQEAQEALEKINNAIVRKDKIRANLGALQNRLENTVTNISVQAENLQAAESRLSDMDVATEMTNFVRQQILTQSATAMLGQANSLPQSLIQLIG